MLRQVADFANVFKAFIGTNWIGLPFAFKESGFVVSYIICRHVPLTEIRKKYSNDA